MARLNTHVAVYTYMHNHPKASKAEVVGAMLDNGHDPSTVAQVWGKVSRGQYQPSTRGTGTGGASAAVSAYMRAHPSATKTEMVKALLDQEYDPSTLVQAWYKYQKGAE